MEVKAQLDKAADRALEKERTRLETEVREDLSRESVQPSAAHESAAIGLLYSGSTCDELYMSVLKGREGLIMTGSKAGLRIDGWWYAGTGGAGE